MQNAVACVVWKKYALTLVVRKPHAMTGLVRMPHAITLVVWKKYAPDTCRLEEICLDMLCLEGMCPDTRQPEGTFRVVRHPDTTCLTLIDTKKRRRFDNCRLEGYCGAHLCLVPICTASTCWERHMHWQEEFGSIYGGTHR